MSNEIRAQNQRKQGKKYRKNNSYGIPADSTVEPADAESKSEVKPVLIRQDTPPGPSDKAADKDKDEAQWSARIGTTPDTRPGTSPGGVDSSSPSTSHIPATREDDSRRSRPETGTTKSPNATWEEVTQFALNCSILSGTFEDIVIVAYSQRSPSGVCTPQSLHANTALVQRALKDAQLRAYIYATIVRLANADLDAVHSAWE